MEAEVCMQVGSPEELFIKAMLGHSWEQLVDSMTAEERGIVGSRASALLTEELDALELFGRLAGTVQLDCDDAIDVNKVGAVVTAMARRAKLYRDVVQLHKALTDFERVNGRRAAQ